MIFNQISNKVSNKPKIDIEKIVKASLPPLPETAMRISELLQSINVSTKSLANLIRFDPMLTTRILQLANSPIYHQQKDINSIQQAVDIIGTKSLYDIVMLGITADVFAKEISDTAMGCKIWHHSLAVALLAKEICQTLKIDGAEESFLCGLLHDIGKIMLLRADGRNYLNILGKENEVEMLEWERENFGYTHSQIGALVVRRWRLPEKICYVILNHHDASQSSHSVVVAHIVNVADAVANFYGCGLRPEQESFFTFSESVLVLGLNQEQLSAAWENIQADLNSIKDTMA